MSPTAADCGAKKFSNLISDGIFYEPDDSLDAHAGYMQRETFEWGSQNALAGPDSPGSSNATVTPDNYLKNKGQASSIYAEEELDDLKKLEARHMKGKTDNPTNFHTKAQLLAPSPNNKGQLPLSCASNESIEHRLDRGLETWSTTSNDVAHWPNPPVYKVHQSDHVRVVSQQTFPRPYEHSRDLAMPTNPYYQPSASPYPIEQHQMIHGRKLSDPFTDSQPQQTANNVYVQTSAAVKKLINDPHPQEFVFGSKIVYAQDVESLENDLSTDPHVRLPTPHPQLSAPVQNLPRETRASNTLEARKAVREDWIRTGAKQIADLYHAKVAATQIYLANPTPHNHGAMRNANRKFEESANLSMRQEERRNLFLRDKGMTALKTGPENLASDGHAGLRPCALDRSGILLGGSMALMERVCAEAVERDMENRRHS